MAFPRDIVDGDEIICKWNVWNFVCFLLLLVGDCEERGKNSIKMENWHTKLGVMNGAIEAWKCFAFKFKCTLLLQFSRRSISNSRLYMKRFNKSEFRVKLEACFSMELRCWHFMAFKVPENSIIQIEIDSEEMERWANYVTSILGRLRLWVV